LTSVEASIQIDIAEMLDSARGDIGTEPLAADALPPSPAEPQGGLLSKLSQQGEAMLASLAEMLHRLAPKIASGPTWVDKLREWADQVRANQMHSLDAVRNREILRLMHLLEKDPDQGLRFALPLTGDPHRGRGTPGGLLNQRNVDYRSTRQGGPADFWDVQEQHRQRLAERYRELANRELNLGRHRRAAYIFANLLGDFAAAASTLEVGGHYREAAAIYRERLQRSVEEARCLERGGLLSEAIAVYERIEDWEKAGDLFQQLEQRDEAAAAYERAVAKRQATTDHLGAARLLEVKLLDVDRALGELWSGWPDSPQATQCLRSHFELLARRGMHELALERVGILGSQSLGLHQTVTLVEELSTLATKYPAPEVQALAADRTRVRTAVVLGGSPAHSARLTQALARLVPADRLLGRDCQRFARQIERAWTPSTPHRRPQRTCQVVRRFRLPAGAQWKALISGGDTFIAAGLVKNWVTVVRGDWQGDTFATAEREFLWRIDAHNADSPFWLESDRAAMRNVYLHVRGNEPFSDSHELPRTDTADAVRVQSHPACSPNTLAVSCCPAGPFWELSVKDWQLVLSQYQHDGALLGTHDVSQRMGEGAATFSLLARNQVVYLAIGSTLHLFGGTTTRQLDLPGSVQGLYGSAIHSRQRVAATLERGGAVIWDDYDYKRIEVFARELETPLATFTRNGFLVAASREECQVYQSQERKLAFHATAPGSKTDPLAVLATDHAAQFAVVDGDGLVTVYGIP
jgi:tetratricopeptide (TPR) repeat protein